MIQMGNGGVSGIIGENGTVADQIIKNHHSRVNSLIGMDYRFDKKTGYHFHIFPNVNTSKSKFAPTDEKFCKVVEAGFKKFLGSSAVVWADFQDDAKTRYREPDGKLGAVLHNMPVSYLYIWVEEIPGNMLGPDKTLEKLADLVIDASEKAVNG